MIDMETLKVQLKQLRLPTMASRVEAEAANAGKLKISYTQFLARLVEAECLSRTDRSIAARTAKARFPFVRTLEGFDFSFQPCLSPAQIHELGNLSFLEKAENIVFVAFPGRAKTWLSAAFGNQACRAGYTTESIRFPLLWETLYGSRGDGSHLKLLRRYAKVQVLILDDFALSPLTDLERKDLLEIVEGRYGNGSLIITSQRPTKEWHMAIGDPTMADAICDRLFHQAHRIELKGESMRKGKKDR